jgi:hypothetical protein
MRAVALAVAVVASIERMIVEADIAVATEEDSESVALGVAAV